MSCITCHRTDALVSQCPRCSGPTCLEHTPLGGKRCDRCELEFIDRRGSLRLKLWGLLGFSLIWPLFAYFWPSTVPRGMFGGGFRLSPGIGAVDLVLICLLAAIALAVGVAGIRVAVERRRFLAEGAKLPPVRVRT